MKKENSPKGRFIFLCLKERRPKYESAINGLPHDILFVDSLDPLIRHCIKEPPVGVLIDISTGMRIGAAKMIPVFNLNLHWPVLRCNISQNGFATAMRTNQGMGVNLGEALKAIYNGDSAWFNSGIKRNSIRISVPFRVRIIAGEQNSWSPGNIMNLCNYGALVHTCDPPKPGDKATLEIMDLSDKPLECVANTAWARRWEDSVQLPCAGFSFDPDSFTTHFKRTLSDFIFHSFRKNG